ncbi:MAG: TatD family hydrolase [Lachnospiraceae bacterium]|nr:TatD family hydrolase [Lachnospiraceae bacterium]
MIFDTHSHYDDEAFHDDREALLSGLREKGVGWLVNVGADIATSKQALELAEQYDFIYAALGVHPSETEGLTEQDMDWIRENCHSEKVVAVGEFGLDYHWETPDRQCQKKWFLRQIELAKEVNLPIIIHSRDAAEETMEILRQTKAYEGGGVIHCYSYSPEMAKTYIDMGFYIGVGGVLTFKNAKKLKRTVEEIPLEKIVLETDCPYMAPEPNRGKRNDSSYLIYVAEKIGELKGIEPEEVIRITTENARALYRLKN